MNFDEILKQTKAKTRKEITKNIKNVIAVTLDIGKAYTFRIDMSIQEVIDQHFDKLIRQTGRNFESKRFQTYVAAMDNISKTMKACYPFVDLEGIDMGWKIKDIVDIVANEYFSLPSKTLDQLRAEGKIKPKRKKKGD